MYPKWHIWGTFVPQSVAFVPQSETHLLYKIGVHQIKYPIVALVWETPVLKGHTSSFERLWLMDRLLEGMTDWWILPLCKQKD